VTCQEAGCDKNAWARQMCRTHYTRWHRARTGCSVEGCAKVGYAKGLCGRHHRLLVTTGSTDDPPSKPTICSVDDCEKPVDARGWCQKHYTRWLRHGDVSVGEDRRWLSSTGYEQAFRLGHPAAADNGHVYVHRMVLFDAIGPGTHPCHWCERPVTWFVTDWATRLVVDHVNEDRLDNRVENLVPACNRCNIQRNRRQRPNCRNGHPYPENPPIRNGSRVCTECDRFRRQRVTDMPAMLQTEWERRDRR
jgi:hypothetical protein